MGLCMSCKPTSPSSSTAKLISQDGELQEFSYPVKVSFILSKHSNVFICNSDEMEFDDVLTAVKENQELQPGQLYFMLPLYKLGRPLPVEEMASLAVKANDALLNSTQGEKCRCRKKPRFFGGEKSSKVADFGLANVTSIRRNSVNGNGNGNNGRRRLVSANLSVIPE